MPATTAGMTHPTLSLLPKRDGRAKAGHPWVYSNELAPSSEVKGLPPGTLVNIRAADGTDLGTYTYNPHTLIAARRLSGTRNATPDTAWFAERLRHAVRRRERLFASPHYRLIHSEGDDLPGVVIDRFGDVLVGQLTTASMEALKPALESALMDMDGITGILWRNDAPMRGHEGLPLGAPTPHGTVPDTFTAMETGLPFTLNPHHGQKTGWFYDQRANRAFVASLAKGQTVLDICCHTGGFGLTALARGATHATFVDASGDALELAAANARTHKVPTQATMIEGDMFEALEHLAAAKQRFGVVVCDPPAFIKNTKTMNQGLKGYEKMAKLGAAVTAGGGYLTLCSCSHHASPDDFSNASISGIRKAGRSGRIVRMGFADTDHPQHLLLDENGYLKCLTVQLD